MTKKSKRVVVAMSGGVDSSTVAALLVEQGYEVIGLAMKTHAEAPKQNRACCTPDDMRDARHVAAKLGIPFYVLNYEEVFKEHIIGPFAAAYRDGYTPNPCVECNDKVKFVPLLERAALLGADALATGHYARIEQTSEGDYHLMRGVDPQKDQSYFLYRLTQAQMSRLWFPLGGMHKSEVREHASRLGLNVAHKHESQEICFVGASGYAKTVEGILQHKGLKPGRFVTRDGRMLGKHQGIHHFTLGQRKGLGISWPTPLYVTDIDPQSGDVTVGSRDELLTSALTLEDIHWSTQPPGPDTVVQLAQRYHATPIPVRVVSTDESRAQLVFTQPAMRGAPGQAAVLYDGDVVIGGGRIARRDENRSRSRLTVLNEAVTA